MEQPLQNNITEEVNLKCENCKAVEAIFYCRACQKFVCKKCFTSEHRKRTKPKTYDLPPKNVPVRTKKQKCEQCYKNEAFYFCSECDEVQCEKCSKLYHEIETDEEDDEHRVIELGLVKWEKVTEPKEQKEPILPKIKCQLCKKKHPFCFCVICKKFFCLECFSQNRKHKQEIIRKKHLEKSFRINSSIFSRDPIINMTPLCEEKDCKNRSKIYCTKEKYKYCVECMEDCINKKHKTVDLRYFVWEPQHKQCEQCKHEGKVSRKSQVNTFCLKCKQFLCLKCSGKHREHTLLEYNQELKNDQNYHCSQDKCHEAKVYCPDCNLIFCEICFLNFHRKKKKERKGVNETEHKPIPLVYLKVPVLGKKMCQTLIRRKNQKPIQCKNQATSFCRDCCEFYCLKCDQNKHKYKKRKKHKRMKVTFELQVKEKRAKCNECESIATVFCCDCDKALCDKCEVDNHLNENEEEVDEKHFTVNCRYLDESLLSRKPNYWKPLNAMISCHKCHTLKEPDRFFCFDCNQFFCFHCSHEIHSSETNSYHKMIKKIEFLEKKPNKNRKEQCGNKECKRNANFYCIHCDEFWCGNCGLDKHTKEEQNHLILNTKIFKKLKIVIESSSNLNNSLASQQKSNSTSQHDFFLYINLDKYSQILRASTPYLLLYTKNKEDPSAIKMQPSSSKTIWKIQVQLPKINRPSKYKFALVYRQRINILESNKKKGSLIFSKRNKISGNKYISFDIFNNDFPTNIERSYFIFKKYILQKTKVMNFFLESLLIELFVKLKRQDQDKQTKINLSREYVQLLFKINKVFKQIDHDLDKSITQKVLFDMLANFQLFHEYITLPALVILLSLENQISKLSLKLYHQPLFLKYFRVYSTPRKNSDRPLFNNQNIEKLLSNFFSSETWDSKKNDKFWSLLFELNQRKLPIIRSLITITAKKLLKSPNPHLQIIILQELTEIQTQYQKLDFIGTIENSKFIQFNNKTKLKVLFKYLRLGSVHFLNSIQKTIDFWAKFMRLQIKMEIKKKIIELFKDLPIYQKIDPLQFCKQFLKVKYPNSNKPNLNTKIRNILLKKIRIKMEYLLHKNPTLYKKNPILIKLPYKLQESVWKSIFKEIVKTTSSKINQRNLVTIYNQNFQEWYQMRIKDDEEFNEKDLDESLQNQILEFKEIEKCIQNLTENNWTFFEMQKFLSIKIHKIFIDNQELWQRAHRLCSRFKEIKNLFATFVNSYSYGVIDISPINLYFRKLENRKVKRLSSTTKKILPEKLLKFLAHLVSSYWFKDLIWKPQLMKFIQKNSLQIPKKILKSLTNHKEGFEYREQETENEQIELEIEKKQNQEEEEKKDYPKLKLSDLVGIILKCSEKWDKLYIQFFSLEITFAKLDQYIPIGSNFSSIISQVKLLKISLLNNEDNNRMSKKIQGFSVIEKKLNFYQSLQLCTRHLPQLLDFLEAFSLSKIDSSIFQDLQNVYGQLQQSWDNQKLSDETFGLLQDIFNKMTNQTFLFISNLMRESPTLLEWCRKKSNLEKIDHYQETTLGVSPKFQIIIKNIRLLAKRVFPYSDHNCQSILEFLSLVNKSEEDWKQKENNGIRNEKQNYENIGSDDDINFEFVHQILPDLIQAINMKNETLAEQSKKKVEEMISTGKQIHFSYQNGIGHVEISMIGDNLTNEFISMDRMLTIYNDISSIPEKNTTKELAIFSQFLPMLQEAVEGFTKLIRSGFIFLNIIELDINEDIVEKLDTLIKQLRNSLKTWKGFLVQLREDYRFINYFSVSELLTIISCIIPTSKFSVTGNSLFLPQNKRKDYLINLLNTFSPNLSDKFFKEMKSLQKKYIQNVNKNKKNKKKYNFEENDILQQTNDFILKSKIIICEFENMLQETEKNKTIIKIKYKNQQLKSFCKDFKQQLRQIKSTPKTCCVTVKNGEQEAFYLILSFFFSYCKRFPRNRQVLICHEQVQSDEILLFLKRWQQNTEENSIFILSNITKLRFKIQGEFLKQLNYISKTDTNTPLIVICVGESSATNNIQNFLRNGIIKLSPLDPSCLAQVIKNADPRKWEKFTTVYSDLPGQGKTTEIYSRAIPKNEKHQNKKNKIIYKRYRIRNCSQYELIQTLNSTSSVSSSFKIHNNSNKKNILLHFDLASCISDEINYLIWSLFLFNYLEDPQTGHVFHLQENTRCSFELPNLSIKDQNRLESAHVLDKYYILKLTNCIKADFGVDSLKLQTIETPPIFGKDLPELTVNNELLLVSYFVQCFRNKSFSGKMSTFRKFYQKGEVPQDFKETKENIFRLISNEIKQRSLSRESMKITACFFMNFTHFVFEHIKLLADWSLFWPFVWGDHGITITGRFADLILDTSFHSIDRSLDWTKKNFSYNENFSVWENRSQALLIYKYNFENIPVSGGLGYELERSIDGLQILATKAEYLTKYFSQDTQTNKEIYYDVTRNGFDLNQKSLNDPKNPKMANLDFSIHILNKIVQSIPNEELKKKVENLRKKMTKGNNQYVLTPDNFLKMVYIEYRLNCGIPVILMSETGVGKTSLIKYLVEKILDRCLFIFNVNANTTPDEIINFMKKQIQDFRKGTMVHIFFDEFNTAPPETISVFKEIFIDQRIEGEHVPREIRIIGAINPYRTVKSVPKTVGLEYHKGSGLLSHSSSVTQKMGFEKSRQKVMMKNKQNEQKYYAYRVHPLPKLFWEYIFDFGILNPDSERIYIERMVSLALNKKLLSSSLAKNEKCDVTDFVTELSQLIFKSHQILKDFFSDPMNTASLRDCRRAIQLFNFFCGEIGINLVKNLYGSQVLKATVMSLFVCYNCKLDTQMRTEFWKQIFSFMNEKDLKLTRPKTNDYFEKFIYKVRLRFAMKLNLQTFPNKKQNTFHDNKAKIALNQGLTENILVTFICLINKIAIFIIGKPGTSKSLAVELLLSRFSRTSEEPIIEEWKLPRIHKFFYQCSPASTEEGVTNVFQKARTFKEEGFLSVLVLDEVGLAPGLKVLHQELENIDKEVKNCVNVIGLSNWALDAAQMNRVILLQRTSPNKLDLVTTARQIAPTIPKHLIAMVTESYQEIYKMQERPYFGLRDFYTTIKGIVSYQEKFKYSESQSSFKDPICMKNKKFDINPEEMFVWKSICRNFGSRKEMLQAMLQTHFKLINQPIPNPQSLIQENLKGDQNGLARHLMILTKNMTVLPIVENLIKNSKSYSQSKSKTHVIFGSRFPSDILSFSISQNLRTIANALMTNDRVILVFGDDLFAPLYDVLNQHYDYKFNKFWTRIAFGPSTESFPVDNRFRIIVLIDQNRAINDLDAPLLNRFEKQELTAQDYIYENDISIDILEYAEKIVKGAYTNSKLRDFFFISHNDLLPSLVLKVIDEEIDLQIEKEKERENENENENEKKKENKFLNFNLPFEIETEIEKESSDKEMELEKENESSDDDNSNDEVSDDESSDDQFDSFNNKDELIQSQKEKRKQIKLPKVKRKIRRLLLQILKPSSMIFLKKDNEKLYKECLDNYLYADFPRFLEKISSQKNTFKQIIVSTFSPKQLDDRFFIPEEYLNKNRDNLVKLWLIERESELIQKLKHKLQENIINKKGYFFLQIDGQKRNDLFIKTKYLVNKVLQKLVKKQQKKNTFNEEKKNKKSTGQPIIQGKIVFVVHLSPNPNTNEFSFSFERNWEYYFVDDLLPSYFTIKDYLVKNFFQLCSNLIEKKKHLKVFINNNIPLILSKLPSLNAHFEQGLKKLTSIYQKLLIDQQTQDIIINQVMKKVQEFNHDKSFWNLEEFFQNELRDSFNNKKKLDSSSFKHLLQTHFSDKLSYIFSIVVNHLDQNDNFNLLNRSIQGLTEKKLIDLYNDLLQIYPDPPNKIIEQNQQYSCNFPFSFYLYHLCEIDLQIPQNINWIKNPFLEILKEIFKNEITREEITILLQTLLNDFEKILFSPLEIQAMKRIFNGNKQFFYIIIQIMMREGEQRIQPLIELSLSEIYHLIHENLKTLKWIIKLLNIDPNIDQKTIFKKKKKKKKKKKRKETRHSSSDNDNLERDNNFINDDNYHSSSDSREYSEQEDYESLNEDNYEYSNSREYSIKQNKDKEKNNEEFDPYDFEESLEEDPYEIQKEYYPTTRNLQNTKEIPEINQSMTLFKLLEKITQNFLRNLRKTQKENFQKETRKNNFIFQILKVRNTMDHILEMLNNPQMTLQWIQILIVHLLISILFKNTKIEINTFRNILNTIPRMDKTKNLQKVIPKIIKGVWKVTQLYLLNPKFKCDITDVIITQKKSSELARCPNEINNIFYLKETEDNVCPICFEEINNNNIFKHLIKINEKELVDCQNEVQSILYVFGWTVEEILTLFLDKINKNKQVFLQLVEQIIMVSCGKNKISLGAFGTNFQFSHHFFQKILNKAIQKTNNSDIQNKITSEIIDLTSKYDYNFSQNDISQYDPKEYNDYSSSSSSGEDFGDNANNSEDESLNQIFNHSAKKFLSSCLSLDIIINNLPKKDQFKSFELQDIFETPYTFKNLRNIVKLKEIILTEPEQLDIKFYKDENILMFFFRSLKAKYGKNLYQLLFDRDPNFVNSLMGIPIVKEYFDKLLSSSEQALQLQLNLPQDNLISRFQFLLSKNPIKRELEKGSRIIKLLAQSPNILSKLNDEQLLPQKQTSEFKFNLISLNRLILHTVEVFSSQVRIEPLSSLISEEMLDSESECVNILSQSCWPSMQGDTLKIHALEHVEEYACCPNDHVYHIDNCHKPMEEKICPGCKEIIGGKDHIFAKGNRRATLEDVEKIPDLFGYAVFEEIDTNIGTKIRTINSLSYRMIRLMTHFLILTGSSISDQYFNTVKTKLMNRTLSIPSKKQILLGRIVNHIFNDLDVIIQLLSNKNFDDFCEFYHSFLNRLTKIKNEFSHNLKDFEKIPMGRDQFEKIIHRLCSLEKNGIWLDINEMKNKSRNKETTIDKWLQRDKKAGWQWKVPEKWNLDKFISNLNDEKEKLDQKEQEQKLKVTQYYIEHINEFSALKKFKSFHHFISLLYQKYSCEITEEESIEISIQQALEEMYENDSKAKIDNLWNDFKFVWDVFWPKIRAICHGVEDFNIDENWKLDPKQSIKSLLAGPKNESLFLSRVCWQIIHFQNNFIKEFQTREGVLKQNQKKAKDKVIVSVPNMYPTLQSVNWEIVTGIESQAVEKFINDRAIFKPTTFSVLEDFLNLTLLSGKQILTLNINDFPYKGTYDKDITIIKLEKSDRYQEELPRSFMDDLMSELQDKLDVLVRDLEITIRWFVKLDPESRRVFHSVNWYDFFQKKLASSDDLSLKLLANSQTLTKKVQMKHLLYVHHQIKFNQQNPFRKLASKFGQKLTKQEKIQLKNCYQKTKKIELIKAWKYMINNRLSEHMRRYTLFQCLEQIIPELTNNFNEEIPWFTEHFPKEISILKTISAYQFFISLEN
ncbi:hypothetical protein M0813_16232 [Anaeramoeba flamelloides]|uniref:B box-type domain-containing protein n=1 Tax=Anaeramoeba flamelloides TaxID=1746091 RepID=A0ABQ8YZX9_9EUKA|nr:hypothetical protein M0813_16232 [Anaeramoeba flamelloides]